MAYARRYCNGFQFSVGKRKVWNVTGASNLDELRERTQSHILRRLKDEVLDLPDKIITPVYLRLKSKDYEELMGEYYDWYTNKKEESKSLTIQFSKLTKVRQVIAEEKIATTIEVAENIIEQGKKVIIFSNFTEPLQKIHEHFKKQSVYLDGSTSKPARQKAVDDLNNRFYDKRPLWAELSPVTDFRECTCIILPMLHYLACCRQYEIAECAREGFCNFMHLKKASPILKRELFEAQKLSLKAKKAERSDRKEESRRSRSRSRETRKSNDRPYR
jgi:hypothetical protein